MADAPWYPNRIGAFDEVITAARCKHSAGGFRCQMYVDHAGAHGAATLLRRDFTHDIRFWTDDGTEVPRPGDGGHLQWVPSFPRVG